MSISQDFLTEKLNHLLRGPPWSLITSKILEFMEFISFLIAEGGTALAAAWMASHKANFDVIVVLRLKRLFWWWPKKI